MTDDIGMILLSFVFRLYRYMRIMWITIIESMTDFFRPPSPSKKEDLSASVLSHFSLFFRLLKDDFLLPFISLVVPSSLFRLLPL